MFSDHESEAGTYIFEYSETEETYKIRNTGDGVNYINNYKEHSVFGNDKSIKAGLSTFTFEEVNTYTITLSANGTAPICLPFNVILPEETYAYDITAADVEFNNDLNGYTCTMKAIAGPGETLKRGTPAVINGNEGAKALAITMSDYGAKGALKQSILKGNYVESSLIQNADSRKYTFTIEGEKEKFTAFEGSRSIAANQCWIECDMAETNELTICFENSTGIHHIHPTPQQQDNGIYSIDGIRLNNIQKGINIIDDKKILVK